MRAHILEELGKHLGGDVTKEEFDEFKD